jgi:hypothetical protein
VPRITLPDGSVKSFDAPVTARQVAESIGPRLALAAVGCKVNGELRDLSTMLSSDCSLSIVTETRRDAQGNTSPDPDALFLSRHSAAHVMAEAIQDVIGKDVQLAYGPPTETGFFYDMFVPAGLKISSDDFGRIEKRIAEIIKEDRPFTRYEVSAKEGLPKLGREGNKYKADNALRAMGCKGLPTRVVAMSVKTHRRGDPGQELGRPLPRPARALHRPHRRRARHVARLRLLARRRELRPPDPRLRHRLLQAGRTSMNTSSSAKRPSQARPPRHRQEPAPLPHRRDRRPGPDPLDPQGLDRPQGTADLHRRRAEEAGLHRGLHSAHRLAGAVQDLRALPVLQGEPVRADHRAPMPSKSSAVEGCSCAEMMRRVEGVSQRLADGINERTKATTIAADRIMADDKLVEGFMLKPMNCPHHAKIFGSAAPTPTATCPCASPSSAPSIAGSSRANSTA